jgi:glycosyltransferase involved in cell wall biosynthesis
MGTTYSTGFFCIFYRYFICIIEKTTLKIIARNKYIIIIGNYQKDKIESMNRFSVYLLKEYRQSGNEACIISAPVIFGKLIKSNIGIGKWLGYLDKYLLMPFYLLYLNVKTRNYPTSFFHIADHSNAPYLMYLPKNKTLITCHDVLAIKGALGFKETMCESSSFGKLLQKWILANLLKAQRIAAVSIKTFADLMDLARFKNANPKNWKMIPNGFNNNFNRVSQQRIDELFGQMNVDLKTEFILHVGSSLPRKNRELLIKMIVMLGNEFAGNVVFAGAALDENLLNLIIHHGLKNRLISIPKPNHELLLALYSACSAFVFPSWSEGFGWPIIEAQACGALVISSNIQPLHEVGSGGAIYCDPSSPKEFADAFLKIRDKETSECLRMFALENANKYKNFNMIDAYLLLMNC